MAGVAFPSVLAFLVILRCLTSSEAALSGSPRNVILVVVKGLSYDSVASARMQEAANEDVKGVYVLSFEKFRHHGSLRTYDSNFNVGSSLSCNALLCGTYEPFNNSCSSNFSLSKRCVISRAQRIGKSTGLVTTARITSPLPATLYGVGPGSGVEECPNLATSNCSDASYFLVHGSIGKDIDVIIGDGRGILAVDDYESDCSRKDGKNLFEEWKQYHPNGLFFNDTVKFVEKKITKGEKVRGILSLPGLNEYDDNGKIVKTHLGSVAVKAIKILKENAKGYFMVVIVDDESLVNRVIMANKMVDDIWKEISTKDTLLIVTSDYARVKEYKPLENDGYTTEPMLLQLSATDATTISSGDELNSTYTTMINAEDNMSINDSKSVFLEKTVKQLNEYVDVPIYAQGPYPGDMPATLDQASFGIILQTLIKGKKHLLDIENSNERELLNINSGGPNVEDDMFQSDINEVFAEIDEMAKEFFDGWLPSK